MERGGKVFGNDNGQSFAEDAWITRERKLRCSIEDRRDAPFLEGNRFKRETRWRL